MKPKTNRASSIYVPEGMDACQTPPWPVDLLVPYLPTGAILWEPCTGEGLMADKLESSGFTVLRSDLLTGENFFEYTPGLNWDVLVTNPPYSQAVKYPFIARCYELGKPFALLMQVETLGVQKAQVHFMRSGVEVIFLPRRVNFKMPNIGFKGSAAQFPVAWFTWGLNIGQGLTFIAPHTAQLSLFETEGA